MGLEGAVRLGFRKELSPARRPRRDALFQLVAKSHANGGPCTYGRHAGDRRRHRPWRTRAPGWRVPVSARVGMLGPALRRYLVRPVNSGNTMEGIALPS